ncbi:MAG: sugar transferase [bacterium]
MNRDGTLNLDCFINHKLKQNINLSFARAWQFLKRDLVICPLFWGVALLTIIIVPKNFFANHPADPHSLSRVNKISKRIIDVLGSIVGLIVSSLLFVILPVLIKLDSEGRVFYKQTRIGKNRRRCDRRQVSLQVPLERRKGERRRQDYLGKPFQVYKFRSMWENAEKKIGPVWATHDDPRVTNVGKVLRAWHLDEIPQFVNVLKGDMSLVGPRPERPELISQLSHNILNYEKRFRSKPGITGLAQLTCGYDTSIQDVRNKLQYDIHYVNNGNLTADLKILFLTLKEVIPNGHTNNGKGSRNKTVSKTYWS